MTLIDADMEMLHRLAASAPNRDYGEGVSQNGLILPKMTLTVEQQRVVDAAMDGHDVVVDSVAGAGKTTTIQYLCDQLAPQKRVLYLTYSKLLKADARMRVGAGWVQNYHGVVYPSLLEAGLQCGVGESIEVFNANFDELKAGFRKFDTLVVDEYQDITEEYAQLIRNIMSTNHKMQLVLVGDIDQRVKMNTDLDVHRFAREVTSQPQLLPFTQSFRMGPELAHVVGKAWGKKIEGLNENQEILFMSADEAYEFMSEQNPGDLLALGRRSGGMTTALNLLEEEHSATFNKNSVFASIRDSDQSMEYDEDTAVFTTFDASKGLERPVSVVYDFDEAMWNLRRDMPNTDLEILRNIFLVAATRGKDKTVFVGDGAMGASLLWPADYDAVGYLSATTLRDYNSGEESRKKIFKDPFMASSCFEFMYAERVNACFNLLEVTPMGVEGAAVIDIERVDGMIDLSPAVGHYQEALFFEGYDAESEAEAYMNVTARVIQGIFKEEREENKEPYSAWIGALRLTAAQTEQMRYVNQVDRTIPLGTEMRLIRRLEQLLPREAEVQRVTRLAGTARDREGYQSPFRIGGIIDAVHQGVPYELKFVGELSREMHLQLGLYLVLEGFESGVLWNTRTDERVQIRVPDRRAFMNAVVRCVTKGSYQYFDGDIPAIGGFL